jgi:hypothetical protein
VGKSQAPAQNASLVAPAFVSCAGRGRAFIAQEEPIDPNQGIDLFLRNEFNRMALKVDDLA